MPARSTCSGVARSSRSCAPLPRMASRVPPRPKRRSPPRHPPPPPLRDAPRHPLPLLAAGGPWVRIFRVAPGRSALYFGQARTYRFDDPLGRFGVLYAAEELAGAFIETFGRAVGVHLIAFA